ncbi:MAG: response regulator transcription factor [Cyanobacteria bacterium SBLK]|nr:response regulator transcription factor [Cyanobacteria bacterium SBLK]
MRILLVEDDLQLSESLAEALTSQGDRVDMATDGEIAWQFLKTLTYDLLLLDVTLPKLDGIGLCRRVRSRGYLLPILMLTARDTTHDKIVGLDAGADVYMVKPFNLGELLAQIRALMRRGQVAPTPVLSWENLSLNPSTYEVTYGDRPLRLTPKEFAILELLLRHGKQVLNRCFIIESLWSLENSPGEETVKVHIKSLRKKLRHAGAPKDWIQTVHGLGYRLKSSQKN